MNEWKMINNNQPKSSLGYLTFVFTHQYKRYWVKRYYSSKIYVLFYKIWIFPQLCLLNKRFNKINNIIKLKYCSKMSSDFPKEVKEVSGASGPLSLGQIDQL